MREILRIVEVPALLARLDPHEIETAQRPAHTASVERAAVRAAGGVESCAERARRVGALEELIEGLGIAAPDDRAVPARHHRLGSRSEKPVGEIAEAGGVDAHDDDEAIRPAGTALADRSERLEAGSDPGERAPAAGLLRSAKDVRGDCDRCGRDDNDPARSEHPERVEHPVEQTAAEFEIGLRHSPEPGAPAAREDERVDGKGARRRRWRGSRFESLSHALIVPARDRPARRE